MNSISFDFSHKINEIIIIINSRHQLATPYKKMDLGTSVALFLTLAVVILVLFCLVTKYFQYRMKKKAQQQGETFSQVDEVTHMSEEDIEGQYEQFLEKRKQLNEEKGIRGRDKAYMFEKTEVEDPLKDHNEQVYGVSMLRKRLDGQVPPAAEAPEQTGRSVPSIKSFRPQRMQTGRSSLSTQRGFMPNSSAKNPEDPLSKHEFVSRLIAYTQQGLVIMNVQVSALIKTNGKITQKKTINSTRLSPHQLGFEDQLEVLGFQHKNYSCMKYKISTQIPYMIENQEYPVSALKTSQSKQEIDFSQYYMIKDKVESSLG